MKLLLQIIVVLMLSLCVKVFPQVDSLFEFKQEVNLYVNPTIATNSSDVIKALHKKMLEDGFLIVESIQKYWKDSEWVNYWRDESKYNNDENLIEELKQLWNIEGSIWEDFSKMTIEYSENNLPATVSFLDWVIDSEYVDDGWYYDFRYVQIYDPIIRSLAINSSGDVFAGTAGGGVFLSTDNGTEWVEINNGFSGSYVYSLVVNSSGDVFAGTEVGVFLSTDNGTEWVQINNGLTDVTDVWSLAINSSDDVYAGTDRGVFLFTENEDGWTQINSTLDFTNTQSLAINSSGDIFAGTTGAVFLSTDNGDSWTYLWEGLTNENVYSLAINSSGDVFAGTAGGGVFLLTDINSAWVEINNGFTGSYVYSLAINSSGEVFAGTEEGIFFSSDNGSSWSKRSSGSDFTNTNSIAINSSDNVFAGTAGEGIFLSTNNGVIWTEINSGLTNAEGSLRTGILTQDWRVENGWYDIRLQTYYYDSNNNLISRISGLKTPTNRHILRYDNNNLTEELWQIPVSGSWQNQVIWTYSYDDDQNNLETILCQNWDSQSSSWINVRKTDFVYENNLITETVQVGSGSDWENSSKSTQKFDTNNNLTEILVELWQDGSWVNSMRYAYNYDEAPLYRIYKVNANLIEEVKQQWDGSDWINVEQQTYAYIPTSLEETKERPVMYTLFQNYPNPFNPSTTIKYAIPNVETHSHASVQIKIYDVLGREIATLVNQQQKAGYYEVQFDASNLTSGVYFYQIRAGEFVKAKKMLLLR